MVVKLDAETLASIARYKAKLTADVASAKAALAEAEQSQQHPANIAERARALKECELRLCSFE
jgi:hypothetical protein